MTHPHISCSYPKMHCQPCSCGPDGMCSLPSTMFPKIWDEFCHGWVCISPWHTLQPRHLDSCSTLWVPLCLLGVWELTHFYRLNACGKASTHRWETWLQSMSPSRHRQAESQALGSACRQGHLLSLLQLARLQGLILRSQLIVLLKHKVGPSASGTSRWWETLG